MHVQHLFILVSVTKTPPKTLGDLTRQLLLDGVQSHPSVRKARAERKAVAAELDAVRRAQATLISERKDLLEVTTVSRGSAREAADRVVAIGAELQELETRERAVWVRERSAAAALEAAVQLARSEELVALQAAAREIVCRLIPAVEAVASLNSELEVVLKRAGYHSSWPMVFGVGSPVSAAKWLMNARDFVSVGSPGTDVE